tara:strand:+ start:215 stop:1162 length:948 start_codon:yes stop_codon:yes gene_type:complete
MSRAFIPVEEKLLKDVYNYLTQRNIIDKENIHGVVGISCMSLIKAVSEELSYNVKFVGGRKNRPWIKFVEDNINSEEKTKKIKIINLTYPNVTEEDFEGEFDIIDVSWLNMAGEKNKRKADCFVCSGHYLMGRLFDIKLSFMFFKDKHLADKINKKTFINSTGVKYNDLKIVEQFISRSKKYDKMIKNDIEIKRKIFIILSSLVNLFNIRYNKNLSISKFAAIEYFLIDNVNDNDKKLFHKYLENKFKLKILDKKDEFLNLRFYSPVEREKNILLHIQRMKLLLNEVIIFDKSFLHGQGVDANKYDKYIRNLLNL